MRIWTLPLLIILVLPGCAENQERQNVEFEGLHNNKIRVLVQVRTIMEDPACEGAACREGVIASARERCILLLQSMLAMRNAENAGQLNTALLQKAVHAPHVVQLTCGELSCNALVDFNIRDDLAKKLHQDSEHDK